MLVWALTAMIASQVSPPAPLGPLPSANQMAWYDRRYYAFVHFGPNTFTGNEWGHGTEDPKVFNPTELDCRQWVRTFKEAGMTGVILTAKHHDGFALFPSAHTKHSVESSPWRGGKGDVLQELATACKEAGLWLGVYLSPWDRNHPTYGTPEYNQVFVRTLTETLTRYGYIKEVWFDGANGEGPNGKRQVYDWPLFTATVRRYAPNAVIFHDGGDVRWVGNEAGYVGETNWSFLPDGIIPGAGNNALLFEGSEKGTYFSPSECNTSIRPGWFWRAQEDNRVKSLEQLKHIFYRSIGHGGNLLLNIPPDDRGLIHENDAAALVKFRRWREATFAQNLAKGATAKGIARGQDPRFAAERVLDGDPSTYWATNDGETSGSIEVDLGSAKVFNHVALSEAVRLGQRIRRFEVLADGAVVAKGTTVGFKRILKFEPISARKVGVRILDARACPTLSSVEVYAGLPEVRIQSGDKSFVDRSTVVLESDFANAEIRYSLDGRDPLAHGKLYDGPLAVDRTQELRAVAVYAGRSSFEPLVASFRRFSREDLWPSTAEVDGPEGVGFAYFEQGWQTLAQMKDAKPVATGAAPGFDIGLRKRNEHFAFRFKAWVYAPRDGIYTFHVTSDDGGRLAIGEHLIVDNDGLHGMETKSGEAPLAAGWHPLTVEYFNAAGGLGLELHWQGPDIARRPLDGIRVR